jgi:hypothetical protein
MSGFPLCSYNDECFVSGIFDNAISNLKLYPNPTTDYIYIDGLTGKTILTVFDVTGRSISTPIDRNKIDVSVLPSGLYYLQLQNKYGVTTTKFSKE